MIDRDLCREIVNRTLSRGGEFADLYVEWRTQTTAVLEDSRLEKLLSGTDAGAGIRLIYRGKTSYSYSNDLSGTALMQVAAVTAKTAQESQQVRISDMTEKKPGTSFQVVSHPGAVPVKNKIDILRIADREARSFDPRITQVTAVYRDTVQKVLICSSDGYVAEDERIYTTATVHVVAAEGGIIQTGYESVGRGVGFELFDRSDIRKVALAAAQRAVMMLGARQAPGGRMPVVISSQAGGTMIHEAIGHGLEADLARQGLSVFAHERGKEVASRLITVIDDATMAGERGSYRFDDEGIPAQKTLLVEKGVLKTFLYDRLSSMRDRTESSGNGRRESYRNQPIPRMSNTYIAPGESRPEDIVQSLDSGLLVEKMGGGQVNTVTGDFVFQVQEGYLIEGGKKGEAVRGATLTGNGPHILKSIDMVGNDLGFSIGTCGKDGQGVPISDALPTLRIPEMVVGGAHGK